MRWSLSFSRSFKCLFTLVSLYRVVLLLFVYKASADYDNSICNKKAKIIWQWYPGLSICDWLLFSCNLSLFSSINIYIFIIYISTFPTGAVHFFLLPPSLLRLFLSIIIFHVCFVHFSFLFRLHVQAVLKKKRAHSYRNLLNSYSTWLLTVKVKLNTI